MEGVVGNSNVKSNDEKRSRGRRPEGTADWAPAFIGALMEGASVRRAVKVAGVDLTLPYHRRKTDEVFRQAWREAVDIGTEFLEQEAARRAYHGTLRPVFQKGTCVGHVREYSDTLMIFLLKARRPEVYREGVEDEARRGNTVININVAVVDSMPAPVEVNHQGEQGAVVFEVVPGGNGSQ